MLFGIDFCSRCDKPRRRIRSRFEKGKLCPGPLVIALCVLVFTVLLFIAPQWLLVLLVLLLTAAVAALICLK